MTNDNKNTGSFWTTIPGILTGIAGVLAGMVAIIQVFKPPTNSPIPKDGTNSTTVQQSSIEVDAKSDVGTPFTNTKNKPIQIKFRTQGKWLVIPANVNDPKKDYPKGFISPNGGGNFGANPNRSCPGYALGALVVKTSKGECIASGVDGTFDLTTGQTVYFLANDVKGLYGDNDGSVKVDLSIAN